MTSHVSSKSAQVPAMQFELYQVCQKGYTLGDFNGVQEEKVGTQPSSIILDAVPVTLLLLSPSSSISTTSPPDTGSVVWDMPKTPIRQSFDKNDSDISTPLTSLTQSTTPDDFGGIFGPRVKSVDLARDGYIPPTPVATPDSKLDTKNLQSAPTGLVLNEGASQELFHSCRDILQAITDKHSQQPRIQYSPKPMIDFLSTPKTQMKNTKTVKRESEDAKPQGKTGSSKTTSVDANSPRSTGKYKGLQALLEHIIPSDIHIKMVSDSALCVASCVGNPNKRCHYKPQAQFSNAHEILKKVSSCIKKGKYTALPRYLEQLVELVVCGHHKNAALRQHQHGSRVDSLRNFIAKLPQASEADLSTFTAWTMALADRDHHLLSPLLDDRTVRESSPAAATPRRNTTAASSNIATSHLPGFLPYKSTTVSDTAIAKALKEMIAKPLTESDMKSGFIYIFWDQGNFGMVKIGRTNNLERRLKEWNKCRSTHSYLQSTQNGELVEVPHVQRIEKLIHTELVNNRKTRACSTCKTRVHKEWFDVSEARAVEVFQKWRGWILQEPYVEDDEGTWTIRPELLDTLPEDCKAEPEKAQSPQNLLRNVRRSKRAVLQRSTAMKASSVSYSGRGS